MGAWTGRGTPNSGPRAGAEAVISAGREQRADPERDLDRHQPADAPAGDVVAAAQQQHGVARPNSPAAAIRALFASRLSP